MLKNLNIYTFSFLGTFFFIFLGIFTHPINFFDFNLNLNTYLNITIYIILIFQVFLFKKNFKNINLKNFKLNLVLQFIFFFQLVGSFNLFISKNELYQNIGMYSIHYFICALVLIISIINNSCVEKKIQINNFIYIFIFFFLITISIIILTNQFNYGLFQLKLLGIELAINSNGFGRLTLILAAVFWSFFNFNHKKIYKIIFFLLTFYFTFLTLILEGRLNFILLFFSLFLISILYKKCNTFFFLLLIFSTSILAHNVKVKVELDRLKINNLYQQEQYTKFNSLRVFQAIKAGEPYSDCAKCPEITKLKNNKTWIKQIENISNGRLFKWINIIYLNDMRFWGGGSQYDRYLLSNKFIKINNGDINNDASGGIAYLFASAGVWGLLFYLTFVFIFLKKMFLNFKNKNFHNNLLLTISSTLIITLILRSFLENSFTIYGIDFIIISVALGLLHYSQKQES